MLKKVLLVVILFVYAGFGFAATANLPSAASQIKIKNAVIEMAKMGPYGQKNFDSKKVSTEAKMDIINTSLNAANLIAATSPISQKVQLHHFVEVNGKTVMQQIPSIKIKAHSQDDLSFQGIHIMLIGLKSNPKKGQKIPLTLIFSDGSHLTTQAVVL